MAHRRASDDDTTRTALDRCRPAAIAQVIHELLSQRSGDKTICPSEAARALLPDGDWRGLMDAVRSVAVDEVRAGRNPLDEGGLVALLASPEQQAVLGQVSGMMSLLEGHGDVTMDRAGADLIPSAERFGRVLRQRRKSASGPAKLLQQLILLKQAVHPIGKAKAFPVKHLPKSRIADIVPCFIP